MTIHTDDKNSTSIAHDAYAGIKVHLTPAPLLRRMMAYCIDVGIVSAMSYAVMVVLSLLVLAIGALIAFLVLGKIPNEKELTTFLSGHMYLLATFLGVFVLSILGALLLNHAYFIRQEFKKGSTFGKKIMGLKVVSMDGSKLTLRQCIGREVLRYVDCALIFPGLISTLFTERRQRLGDLLVGTIVVYSKSLEEQSQFLYLKRDDYLLINSHVTVDAIDSAIEADCLLFAYQYFVQKTMSDEVFIGKWLDFADGAVHSSEDFPLHPKDKLLFAAEFLRQKSIARKKP